MHFCTQCGNMYYLKLNSTEDSNDNLVYYCRKCGYEDNNLLENKNNLYVSRNEMNIKSNFKNIINKYTKLDPTIPRINTIDCPNSECPCNTDDSIEKEILYIRYDNSNMKFIYLCAHCDKIWNIE